MKHLNFLTKTRWLLVPLMLLTLGVGNVWGAKITAYGNIVSGKTYYIGATISGTDYYFKANGGIATSSSNQNGVSVTNKADATPITITISGTSGTLQFSNGNYLYLPANNGKYQSHTSQESWTFANQNNLIRLTNNSRALQRNNQANTAVFGSYASTQKDVWLEEVPTSNTVVWTINPAAGGTLSNNSGTSTTVTPNSAYTYDSPAYTVTTGSATVSQTTNTFTATPTANCTIRINMVEKPKYKITYNAGTGSCGTASWTQTTAGQSTTLPTATPLATCSDWTFYGWCITPAGSAEDNSTSPGTILTGSYTPTENVTLYAIYKRTVNSGGSASLTKMVKGNTLSDGDKLVVVANGTDIAMYQETTSSSYVQTWDCSTLNATTVGADSKNWWTVTATTGGFYLGDATNGYLNMSSNNLYCNETQSVWTLSDLEDGTFRLQSGSRNLSYRSDLSTTKWRMGGTSYGTSGQTVLDLYKYSAGGGSTTYYMTSLVCCTELGSIKGSFNRIHF